jgi:orotidine-5'-phosphate decarboxylase
MESYATLLTESAQKSGNCACMGLDPQWDLLPELSGNIRSDLVRFFSELFTAMVDRKLSPAAFKPNIGYYHVLDNPRAGEFEGSLALADMLSLLEQHFPAIPVILDAKRGDIARSSENYAHEAFDVWLCDAITASPYMGTDSVSAFNREDSRSKGVYLLNRTSNPGAKDLQDLTVIDAVDEQVTYPLYLAVAHRIARWAEHFEGVGAVVGATSIDELAEIATYYAPRNIPLLIPGVGSQGASATKTMQVLRDAGYPMHLARINSSSALTHPWKKAPAPSNYLERCLENIESLCRETSL